MERIVVPGPRVELDEVDVSAALATAARLLDRNPDVRESTRRKALTAPQRLPPPVLFALAESLLVAGRAPEAAHWWHVGRIRAHYDAARCTDPTAAVAIGSLDDRVGPAVRRWASAGPDRVRPAAVRAVLWDRAAAHDYDHRWIARHGRAARTGSGGPVDTPRSQWPAAAARVRADYLVAVRGALRGHSAR